MSETPETHAVPPDLRWLYTPCPTCEHGILIELVREGAGPITGVRFHDSRPESLPPGAIEILRAGRCVDQIAFLTAWDGAEAAP